MISQLLKMAEAGLTTNQLMGIFNLNYNSAYYHIKSAKDKGLIEERYVDDKKMYFTTSLGFKELEKVMSDEATVAEIPTSHHVAPLTAWYVEMDKWIKVDKDAAQVFIGQNYPLFVRLLTYSAVVYGDTSQLERLTRTGEKVPGGISQPVKKEKEPETNEEKVIDWGQNNTEYTGPQKIVRRREPDPMMEELAKDIPYLGEDN